jgi:hypothetical protein
MESNGVTPVGRREPRVPGRSGRVGAERDEADDWWISVHHR